MRNQDKQATASNDAAIGHEILPKSTNIRLSSNVSDQAHEVRELELNVDGRQTRRSSELFRRLMSMDTLQSMSMRNLLTHNPIFRKRALAIAINVISRTLTLAMNVVLVLLSAAFCVAQLSEVNLKLYNECEPKTLDEIYHHSYLAGLQDDGTVNINAESQWGQTKDACYTTRTFQENTDQLWYSNFYEHEWNIRIDYMVVFFGLTSVYSLLIFVYNLVNLVRDIRHLRKNTVHTLSNDHNEDTRAWSKFVSWLNDLVETENTRWVIRCVLLECTEFIVAVLSMLLYNGYNWNDPENEHDVYLAKKPHFIKLYAAGIAANMFGSALLWMTYMTAPEMCHGLTFRTAFFFVEDLSDLFYTFFPIIVAYNDTYNANANDMMVLLGQFQVDNFVEFASRFFFLAILCFKTHHLVYSSHQSLMNRYYSEFNLEEERPNWIEEDDPHVNDKRCFLFSVSALYTVLGIIVLVLVSTHFNKAATHCDSVNETLFMENGYFDSEQQILLESNPELFLWDYCLYQTLPFTDNDQQRCQCRVFILSDWANLKTTIERRHQTDLSLSRMLRGLFENNIMLEKFWTDNNGGYAGDVNDGFDWHPSMFKSVHMKAFYWTFGGWVINFGDHLHLWSQMQYMDVDIASNFGNFQNFKHLRKLKHLRVIGMAENRMGGMKIPGLSDKNFSLVVDSICHLEHLQFLNIDGNVNTIPHCFDSLQDLRILDIAGTMKLTAVPLSIFNLPKLEMLDLFRGLISWDTLLDYNLPVDVDRSNPDNVKSWMDAHFSVNSNAEVYFQLNPICDELSSVLSDNLRDILDISCDWMCTGLVSSGCDPRFIADGVCDSLCNSIDCNYDGGDCIQLCFTDELTQCSWSDLLNEQCDEICNNEYCSGYKNRASILGWGNPDFQHVPDLGRCESRSVGAECQSSSSHSAYLDPLLIWDSSDVCLSDWVGDGSCDDLCRTVECLHDVTDCDLCSGVCAVADAGWKLFYTENVWNVEHNWFCEEVWQRLIGLVGEFEGSDDCEGTVKTLDFNQDENLNFREFSALVGGFMFGFEDSRHLQINCAVCVSEEFYNV